MKIRRNPEISEVRSLLKQVGLPTADLSPTLLQNFLGIYVDGELTALGGLDIFKPHALIRSIAVLTMHRGQGLASLIITELEKLALASRISDLYLLTETAELYFFERGYKRIERNASPQSIATTAQFQELCPADAAFMHKRL